MPHYKDAKTSRKIAVFIKKTRGMKYPGWGGRTKAAEDFGTSANLWSKWEAGASVPNDVNQRKLAEFFDITLAELRGDNLKSAPAFDAEALDEALDNLGAHAKAHKAAGRLLAYVAATLAATARGALPPSMLAKALETTLQALQKEMPIPKSPAHAAPGLPQSRPGKSPSSAT